MLMPPTRRFYFLSFHVIRPEQGPHTDPVQLRLNVSARATSMTAILMTQHESHLASCDCCCRGVVKGSVDKLDSRQEVGVTTTKFKFLTVTAAVKISCDAKLLVVLASCIILEPPRVKIWTQRQLALSDKKLLSWPKSFVGTLDLLLCGRKRSAAAVTR